MTVVFRIYKHILGQNRNSDIRGTRKSDGNVTHQRDTNGNTIKAQQFRRKVKFGPTSGPNLSQTISHSLRADSVILRPEFFY